MGVELGRTWGVRHEHLRFASFVGSTGSAAMHNRDGWARRQHHEPNYGTVLLIGLHREPPRQDQRKREIERRRAG